MNRRQWMVLGGGSASAVWLSGCAGVPAAASVDPCHTRAKGTGDLGVVVLRASGELAVVDTSARTVLGRIAGLGDLSHASLVFSRDGASAFVFGRDGALTKVNLLTHTIETRVMQAGNSIGGSISQDGRLVVAQNYTPGGIKVFDANTLETLADVPAIFDGDRRSRVVGLRDLPRQRFIFSLFDGDETWVADLSVPRQPQITRLKQIGRQPYDALITPDGRHYIAGLFGEDGLAMIDLWEEPLRVRRILPGYGRGEQPLPVFKMPHLRGWAVAGRQAWLPAIGRHEVLVVDTESWAEVGRVTVAGQPVFVIARPDGRQVWVNFALPHHHRMEVIDVPSRRVVRGLEPGRAVMHMEFTPRGESVWVSSRDDNRVAVIDTNTFETQATLALPAPSGIFFTSRAARLGF